MLRAEPEGMHDTLAPFPVPPRPDTGFGFPPDPDQAVGDDFYRPSAGGTRRMVRLLAVITTVCLLAGLVGPPILHAWESGRKSHEFSFMATLGDRPVRWNPCEPIHYVVNLGAAPAGSLKDVHDAVLRITSATGIAFVFDGLSDEVPTRERPVFQPDRYGDRWAPVLIGWVDPRTSSFDFDPGGREAAGVAGPLYPQPGSSTIYVSGVVAINAADPNPPGWDSQGAQGPVVLHELAHVMGLGHYQARGELMEPSGGGMTDFGPGDLQGLRELGSSAGCLTTPPAP